MKSDHHEFLSVLGFLFLQNGKSQKAVTVYQTLQLLRPDDAQVALSSAYASLQAGLHTQALTLAEQWIDRIAPDEVQWRHLQLIRSRALFELGQTQEAQKTVLLAFEH